MEFLREQDDDVLQAMSEEKSLLVHLLEVDDDSVEERPNLQENAEEAKRHAEHDRNAQTGNAYAGRLRAATSTGNSAQRVSQKNPGAQFFFSP